MKPQYFTKTQLRERGWTDSLVKRFLAEPDEERVNPHYKSGPPMSLYLQARVVRKEKSKTFKEAQVKRLAIKMTVEERKQREKEQPIPILPALFTLNRRAKRCRDLAQRYYHRGKHHLAIKSREEKERIYELKGQVLHHLISGGILEVTGYHRFHGDGGGNWAEILTGSGYSFHRPCPQPAGEHPHEVRECIEAKPKGAKEPTISAAYASVQKFISGKRWIEVYKWQSKRSRSIGTSDYDDEEFDER